MNSANNFYSHCIEIKRSFGKKHYAKGIKTLFRMLNKIHFEKSHLDEAARDRRKSNEDFVQENMSTQAKTRLLNRMARVSVSSDNGEDCEETRY